MSKRWTDVEIDAFVKRREREWQDILPSDHGVQLLSIVRQLRTDLKEACGALQSIVDLDPPPAIGHAEPRIQTGLMWAVDIARGALK